MISPQRRAEVVEALRRGTVPKAGLDALAVGYGRLQGTLDEELDAVASGRGAFKAIRGEYGSGKTFFGRWLQERARARGLATSEVQISETETASNAHYDSMQLTVNKRFSRGFSVMGNYTFAKSIDAVKKTTDEVLGAGYGIFGGSKVQWAKLHFTPERARWVAYEQWHPRQKGTQKPDGSYLLEIPYADDRELMMDILKYGPDVEVLAPVSLRKRVQELLAQASQRYA